MHIYVLLKSKWNDLFIAYMNMLTVSSLLKGNDIFGARVVLATVQMSDNRMLPGHFFCRRVQMKNICWHFPQSLSIDILPGNSTKSLEN